MQQDKDRQKRSTKETNTATKKHKKTPQDDAKTKTHYWNTDETYTHTKG